MIRLRVVLAAIVLSLHSFAATADTVTIGQGTVTGTTAIVPVYVRDIAGTPLGVDAGAEKRIQSLALKVLISPASAVTSATISRSGITQSLSPLFESAPATANSASYIGSFQESTSPIPFTLNAPAPGDEVAKITLTLSAAAQPGSTITLSLDPATTSLSNQNGTITEAPPELGLNDGGVSVPAIDVSLTPPSQQVAVGEAATFAATLSTAAPASGEIALSVSPAGIVTVPATVPIAAGARSASFNATAIEDGTATVTATLPAAFGGRSGTATVIVIRFTTPTPPGNLSPPDGAAGLSRPVQLRWLASAGATRYDIHIGTSPDPPHATSVNATSTDQTVQVDAGTTYYWKIVAVNPAGTSAGPEWSFTTEGASPACPTPAAPVITAPADVIAGQTFTLRWQPVANATEYRVEESANANFATKTTTVAASPATQTTFTKQATQETRYFYRVLAHNGSAGCNIAGAFSAVAVVLVKPLPPSQTRIIPVAGSTAGSFGSFFRTAVQLHNPGATPITGHFVYHPQGTSETGTDVTLNYALSARATVSYADILNAMGVQGLGTVELVTDTGGLPRVVTRIYNDGGERGTAGMTLPLIRAEEALTAGKTGLLIAPIDAAGARFNLGFRTLNAETEFTLKLINAAGSVLKTVSMTVAPNYFVQRTAADVLGTSLGNSDVVEIAVVRGSLIVYGSTTDNITQDTSIQIEVATP